jgi:hypothetical protein
VHLAYHRYRRELPLGDRRVEEANKVIAALRWVRKGWLVRNILPKRLAIGTPHTIRGVVPRSGKGGGYGWRIAQDPVEGDEGIEIGPIGVAGVRCVSVAGGLESGWVGFYAVCNRSGNSNSLGGRNSRDEATTERREAVAQDVDEGVLDAYALSIGVRS